MKEEEKQDGSYRFGEPSPALVQVAGQLDAMSHEVESLESFTAVIEKDTLAKKRKLEAIEAQLSNVEKFKKKKG